MAAAAAAAGGSSSSLSSSNEALNSQHPQPKRSAGLTTKKGVDRLSVCLG
jgi:hypothetical protein